jgi:negative regulator of sigma E activity
MPRIKRGLILGLVAALCLAAAPPDPDTYLHDAVLAYARNSYVGQVQSTDFGSKKATSVLFHIEHRAPNLTRRWYLAPESLYGDSIVAHGDTSYDIDPHSHKIVVMQDDALDDQVAMDDNFGLLLHNYHAVLGPDDNVAGRRTIVVLLINRYTGATVVRIALDVQTKLVLEKEQYSPSGAVAHQMRFENIQFTNDIPTPVFSVPSAGYARETGPGHSLPSSDLRAVVHTAGFATLPKYLPEGFLPIAGDISDIKGVRSLHLLYSDGLRTVSLFENDRGAAVDLRDYTVHDARVGTAQAQYVEEGPTLLFSWGRGNRHFALVGELSHEEMERIAASVG